ncbi:MAG: hypothetical protein PVH73_03970 [Candidatus Bathyarchaeota archaeon]|jgi:hypothetical protein
MPTETILRLLENGKWHHLEDIEKRTQLNRVKIEIVTRFLAKFNFVKLNEAEQKVKIDPITRKFLKKLRQLENEEKR